MKRSYNRLISQIILNRKELERIENFSVIYILFSSLTIDDLKKVLREVQDCPILTERLEEIIASKKEDLIRNETTDKLCVYLNEHNGFFNEAARRILRIRLYDTSDDDRKLILNAFLDSSNIEDRNWAYRQLVDKWYPEFHDHIDSIFRSKSQIMGDVDCNMVILKHFDISFIKEYFIALTNPYNPPLCPRNYSNRDLFLQAQIRLAEEDNGYIIQGQLTRMEYLRTIDESGRRISKNEALMHLFCVVSNHVNFWEQDAEDAAIVHNWQAFYSLFEFEDVLKACEHIINSGCIEAVLEFIEWDASIKNEYYPSNFVLEERDEIFRYFHNFINLILWRWPHKYDSFLCCDMDDGSDTIVPSFMPDELLARICEEQMGNDVVLKMAEKVYKDSHYYRYKKGEDFPTCPVAYVMSPDSNYLYVVTRVYANSNGWTSEYQLQRYNLRTGRQKLITECAGITTDSKGIKVVDCRLVNEDENPGTADEIWMMHDVYYKWNGTKVFNDTSNEYDFDTFGKKYLNKDISYCYVTGMTFFPKDFVQSVW